MSKFITAGLGRDVEGVRACTFGHCIIARQLVHAPIHRTSTSAASPGSRPAAPGRCVTPYIVVPGPWSPSDIEYHADKVAAGLTNNAGRTKAKLAFPAPKRG